MPSSRKRFWGWWGLMKMTTCWGRGVSADPWSWGWQLQLGFADSGPWKSSTWRWHPLWLAQWPQKCRLAPATATQILALPTRCQQSSQSADDCNCGKDQHISNHCQHLLHWRFEACPHHLLNICTGLGIPPSVLDYLGLQVYWMCMILKHGQLTSASTP